MVYIYLCSCAGVANEFLLANNTITQKCSLSKNKIQKAIKELVEIGLLSEKKSQAGNSTTKFLELQLL
jgi:predicted transcriptional regulator